jgi:hypothetical protein
VIAVALLPVMLPARGLIRALKNDTAATSFLTTLWQVHGAAVGLTVAVVLFVFQVFTARSRGSVHEFAAGTGFFPIFYASVAGIALDGLVLLGYGHGAPGGWAATWAAVWSLVTLVLLVVLVLTSLRTIDSRALHRRRLHRSQSLVATEVERIIFDRIASVALIGECTRIGIDAEGAAPDGAVALSAGRAGTVTDVRLRPLRRAAREAREGQVARPRIAIYVGANVGAETDWLHLPRVVANQVPSLSRTLKIRKREQQLLRDTIADLHEDALLAIGAPAPKTYDEIVDTYAEMLSAVPETWARYGLTLEDDVGVSVSEFELSFFDLLRGNLYEEALHALAGRDRDVAQSIINLPIDVARRAVDARALALHGQMLSLFVSLQDALLSSDSRARNELLEWSWLRLYELGSSIKWAFLQNGGDDEREVGRKALVRTFRAFAELFRDLLEHDPTSSLSELNGYWDDIVEDRRGGGGVMHALVLARKVNRLGLCFWTLRRYQLRRDERWLEPFRAMAGYLGDVRSLARVLSAALESEHERGSTFSDWVLHEQPKRRVHVGTIDHDLVRTFVVLALARIDPDGEPPTLDPDLWLVNHLRVNDPQPLVDSVVSDLSLAAALPAERLAERAAMLIEVLRAVIARRDTYEEEQAIEAPLEERLVDEFRSAVLEHWNDHRLFRAGFAAAHAITRGDGGVPEETIIRQKARLTKRLFVSEPRVVGHTMRARQAAVLPSKEERRRFLDAAGVAEALPEANEPLHEAVRAAVADLRGSGFDPTIIFTPLDFQLVEALQLEAAIGWGGEARPPDWLVAENHAQFVGTIDEVPVAQATGIPDDRLLIIDFGGFGRWREWPVEGETMLDVRVTAYTPERARETAAAALARDGIDPSEEELRTATRKLELSVVIELAHAVAIEGVQRDALRWVPIPPREEG